MNPDQVSRRGFLRGSGALAAAGWAAVAGGWVLRPDWAHAASPIKIGIATDVTGALAPSGNSCWQTAQLAVKRINDAGGILGRPVELHLEDTASDNGVAVSNARRLVQQSQVDVVLGGILSSTREALINPIARRGKTLYIYPQLYEGGECTKNVFCTGPTPAQQAEPILRYLIEEQGSKRFALPAANYIWPQVLNKFARKVIEDLGAEVVMEDYFPIDQLEYSAVVAKINSEKVDHVFNTTIPPGLQGFTKQLYESGYYDHGGFSTVYFDENSVNFVPQRELENVYSCLDMFQTVDDPFTQQMLADYREMFPDTLYKLTAGSTSTGTYRGIKFYEQAVIATNGDLSLEAVSEAMQNAEIKEGPGGPARMVPGTGHAEMNMYIAQSKGGVWNIISQNTGVAPQECA
ncbi:substrate-binding protein [Pikeienuella sp. HZG-20]|uniref:substrate-binding protein n=1 Tax=Paludibacillus litoralis TaxID=3133267 RepID=UPI0030EF79EB